jgi:modulator of FtsH protease HflK
MSPAQPHPPDPPPAIPPLPPEDTTGQALAEALRSSFVVIKILMAGLVVFFLCSGMFTVGPQEKAILLRMGRPVGVGTNALRGPGFHWAFPAPIDEVVKIPADQVRTATSTIGWYSTTPEKEAARSEPPPGDSLKPGQDGYVLTADTNIIHLRAVLRYRILDPVRFELGFSNATRFVTNALNNALNHAAARFPVDGILTRDATAFREQVRARLQELILEQQLGILVEQVGLQALPPRQEKVDRAFKAATDAGLQSGRVVNEARTYANDVRSRAQGEAASLTNAALAEKLRLVELVAAEAKQFTALRPQYEANPGLFTLQRQTETLTTILTNAYEKFFIAPGPSNRPREIRLLLSREPEKSSATAPPPPVVDKH